jgi:hypothetical protein
MEKPFWSIADFLDWRSEADLDKPLDELLNRALREQIGLTGQRCSWNRLGADCESDGFSQDILAVDLEDLKFDLVLDGSEFVLIQSDRSFDEEPAPIKGRVNLGAGQITWVDQNYDERTGPVIEPIIDGQDRIHGWGKLRLRADSARALLTGKELPESQYAPLAEWIFAQHRRPTMTFKVLYEAARSEPALGTFTKGDFERAYRAVYASKGYRSPATGWPLRSPYKERGAFPNK